MELIIGIHIVLTTDANPSEIAEWRQPPEHNHGNCVTQPLDVLDPNGTTKVTIENPHDTTGQTASHLVADIAADCRQASLPDNLVWTWKIPTDRKWGVGIDGAKSSGANYFNINADRVIYKIVRKPECPPWWTNSTISQQNPPTRRLAPKT